MTIKIFTVAEMVAAEKAADASGVTYDMMMEIAGRSVAEAIIERVPTREQKILILVGPGNNGGDGLVAGRYLAQAEADVTFFLYKPRQEEKDHNYAQVREMGLTVIGPETDPTGEQLRKHLSESEIIIDALLGTGVTRPISGKLADIFKIVQSVLAEQNSRLAKKRRLTSIAGIGSGSMGQNQPFIAAVDCPSGLNCDSGELDLLAIAADLTVTFAGPKRGHFRFPGASSCGELVVADIDISTELPQVAAVPLQLATQDLARGLLPRRSAGGHKGSFGTALIAAGSARYWGAPVLSAQGAYRAGAGLVALAVPDAIRSTVAGQLPEATYPPVAAGDLFDKDSAHEIWSAAAQAKGVLLGPGMGPAEDFMDGLLNNILRDDQSGASFPDLIIDADGLNILAQWPEWIKKLPANSILTPHPGEMARLMDVSLAEFKKGDRVDLACSQAKMWEQIVVLKGAYTVVAAPDGRCTLMPFANPLLAVGGSGDVLAGVIVGLLAQGMPPYEAAVLGAYLHGAAGELASTVEFGDAGLLAGELASWIPQVRKLLISQD
ncbi:MAG: NAD(P)H-hydrate dehydratase [Candidatus Promineifilaceae bacterium]|nr:NAD(P)H-hydrate dehydratase [Candidatus Promineifilaceae bacterium]